MGVSLKMRIWDASKPASFLWDTLYNEQYVSLILSVCALWVVCMCVHIILSDQMSHFPWKNIILRGLPMLKTWDDGIWAK